MAQILIINHDKQARLGLRWILECEGYRVLDYGGKNRREVSRSDPVDLIITDVVAVDETYSHNVNKMRGGISEIKMFAFSRRRYPRPFYYLQVTDSRPHEVL